MCKGHRGGGLGERSVGARGGLHIWCSVSLQETIIVKVCRGFKSHQQHFTEVTNTEQNKNWKMRSCFFFYILKSQRVSKVEHCIHTKESLLKIILINGNITSFC